MQELAEILQQAQLDIQSVDNLDALELYKVNYLGKKGLLTEQLKALGKLPADQRPSAGQAINEAKLAVLQLINEKHAALAAAQVAQQLAAEKIDITLAGRKLAFAGTHPISKTFASLQHIFAQMGFMVLDGPEIEDDFHNFAALNIPDSHPARAMQDTFYFANGLLLRTHMSPVQIRTLKSQPLPLRMVAMGRVYRRDFDLTHTPMFHQMECLMVDEHITFAELKGLVQSFLSQFFERDIQLRLRPSYFPFTEPSAEVDIACVNCSGKGCRVCKDTGWLEVMGCGMVHPNVLKAVSIDTERYRGFAFGVGVDRLTMLKYGINDLRALFENDLRFLQQF